MKVIEKYILTFEKNWGGWESKWEKPIYVKLASWHYIKGLTLFLALRMISLSSMAA
jgi:hypothetical protein